METRMRIYTLRADKAEDFIDKWRRFLVPLREKIGFRIKNAWYSAETNRFIWVLEWSGEGSYDAAEQKYYDHPDRVALPWSAAEYVENADVLPISSV